MQITPSLSGCSLYLLREIPKGPDMQPQPTGGLADRISMLEYIAVSKVGFGTPTDPQDASGTVLAGSALTSHNGFTDNFEGSWVTVQFEARNVPTTVFHNLNVPIVLDGQLNVRWINFGMSSVNVLATRVIGMEFDAFQDIPSITENSFDLRVHGNMAITAGVPLFVTLFVIPAVRRPPAS